MVTTINGQLAFDFFHYPAFSPFSSITGCIFSPEHRESTTMSKSSKAIFWVIIFFCILLAVDQFLLRVEFKTGGMQVTQEFYLDFRQRLIGLGSASGPKSVEQVISDRSSTATAPAVEAPSPRYLYADENGQLQFADSMEDIPPQFRKGAQRMDE